MCCWRFVEVRGDYVFVTCILFSVVLQTSRLHKTWIFWWHRLLGLKKVFICLHCSWVLVVACSMFSGGLWIVSYDIWDLSLQHVNALVVAYELLAAACGISFPNQELNLVPLPWELGVLDTGPTRKSLYYCFILTCKGMTQGRLRTSGSVPEDILFPLAPIYPVGSPPDRISFRKPSLNVRNQLVSFSPSWSSGVTFCYLTCS